jgi:SpoIID/LytB domain protein
VDETAGVIAVYHGEPIDAMYTSTCGGHTEDAALLFEGRAQPYLRGVPCAWDRPIELVGSGEPQRFQGESEFCTHLAIRALGLSPAAEPQQVVARVAGVCGGRGTNSRAAAEPGQLAAA